MRLNKIINLFIYDINARSFWLLIGSILADLFLFAYNLYFTILLGNSNLWYVSQAWWFLVLLVGRFILLVMFVSNSNKVELTQRSSKNITILSSFILFVLGVGVFARTCVAFASDFPIFTRMDIVLVYGIYIVVKFIFSLLGRFHYSGVYSSGASFIRAKKYFSQAESLYLLIMFYHRLVLFFNYNEVTAIDLTLGIIVSLYIIYLAFKTICVFFYKNKEKTVDDKTSTE